MKSSEILTHETAPGQVELVPSRGHPHSAGVGTDQTWLTLCVLWQEGYHAFHWCPGYCGNTLGGLQECLEQTTLVEDHVVWNTDLRRHTSVTEKLSTSSSSSSLSWHQKARTFYLPPVIIVALRLRAAHTRSKPQAATRVQSPAGTTISKGNTH